VRDSNIKTVTDDGIISSQGSEVRGTQKQATNAGELQVHAEPPSNAEECLLFGVPTVTFWKV